MDSMVDLNYLVPNKPPTKPPSYTKAIGGLSSSSRQPLNSNLFSNTSNTQGGGFPPLTFGGTNTTSSMNTAQNNFGLGAVTISKDSLFSGSKPNMISQPTFSTTTTPTPFGKGGPTFNNPTTQTQQSISSLFSNTTINSNPFFNKNPSVQMINSFSQEKQLKEKYKTFRPNPKFVDLQDSFNPKVNHSHSNDVKYQNKKSKVKCIAAIPENYNDRKNK